MKKPKPNRERVLCTQNTEGGHSCLASQCEAKETRGAPHLSPSIGKADKSVRPPANPIGIAAYQLQSKLPLDLKGKLTTTKQLAELVRLEMEAGK